MEKLSSHLVRDNAPNSDRNSPPLNPGSWPQHWREAIFKEVSPAEITVAATLLALEHAIGALDVIRVGKQIDPRELVATLRELRALRTEYLKAL